MPTQRRVHSKEQMKKEEKGGSGWGESIFLLSIHSLFKLNHFLLFVQPLFVSPTLSKSTLVKTIHRYYGFFISILC